MKEPGRIKIAATPTPIIQSKFGAAKFLIKRDDLTGLELSGNKIRKLEYLLADAVKQKADYIFTCGGEQSNHCRASAIAAASLGLKSKLFLWGKDRVNASGNLFFDKLSGAEFQFLSKEEYSRVDEIMLQEKLKFEKRGKRLYSIPEGGSSELGIWGYINFVRELKEQAGAKKIKGILTACGSGGTTSGLIIGSLLYDFPLKIFAVNVLYDKETIEKKIYSLVERTIDKFKLKLKMNASMLCVVDGYSAEGYKHIEDKKVETIVDYFRQSGILLDPAYTGKAFCAYDDNFLKGRKRNNILFVHTGGLFGVFGKSGQYLKAAR